MTKHQITRLLTFIIPLIYWPVPIITRYDKWPMSHDLQNNSLILLVFWILNLVIDIQPLHNFSRSPIYIKLNIPIWCKHSQLSYIGETFNPLPIGLYWKQERKKPKFSFVVSYINLISLKSLANSNWFSEINWTHFYTVHLFFCINWYLLLCYE